MGTNNEEKIKSGAQKRLRKKRVRIAHMHRERERKRNTRKKRCRGFMWLYVFFACLWRVFPLFSVFPRSSLVSFWFLWCMQRQTVKSWRTHYRKTKEQEWQPQRGSWEKGTSKRRNGGEKRGREAGCHCIASATIRTQHTKVNKKVTSQTMENIDRRRKPYSSLKSLR